MRDPQRIVKLLRKLEKIWMTYAPDMRFGQLFAFLAAKTKSDPFVVEDDEWFAIMKDVETACRKHREENQYGTWDAQGG